VPDVDIQQAERRTLTNNTTGHTTCQSVRSVVLDLVYWQLMSGKIIGHLSYNIDMRKFSAWNFKRACSYLWNCI